MTFHTDLVAVDSMHVHRYINGVKPGTYGVPKPWYFPCLPSYWTGRARRSADPARKVAPV